MAELPFVDTHFHLHDMKHPTLRYGWLEPDAVHGFLPDTDPLKAQRYRIKDYLAEIRFSNVLKAIHVQAAVDTPDPVAETEWLQAFANETGCPQGIVAECHLARPDAAQVLDRHLHYANVRGIRDFGEGRYLVDPAWRRGFAELGPRNLVSCIDTRVELAGDVLDLAKTFPDIIICVDHCAIPMKRDDASFRQWRAAAAEMAKAPNVTMKISGLGMCDPLWTVQSIRPYVLGSIEAFGVDRVVFGANWPVDRMFSSYPDVINAYSEIIAPFAREEQIKMFSGNAERIFRIEGAALAEGLALNSVSSVTGAHHVGIAVANLEKALAFWESFLEKPARWSTVLDRPYLGRIVGYAGVSIKAALVDLPDGVVIELLDYHRIKGRVANPEATANPGNVHLCLRVKDAGAAWKHAASCGARPVTPEGPVEVEDGPNKGAKVAYLRIHDGVTLEVFQPPRPEPAPR